MNRILKGWNFSRALFLIIGGIILIQSVIKRDWISASLGAYFISMGVFALGCASGTCGMNDFNNNNKSNM